VGSIEVHGPGRPAELLLDCLRPKATGHGIDIAHGSTGTLTVTDDGGKADDLAGFLSSQLDECARLLGVDWHEHFTVAQP
jgi:hypothetical protein